MPGPYTATRKNENMNIIEITDLSAPELAPYTKLTEAQLIRLVVPAGATVSACHHFRVVPVARHARL